jgi:ParB-like chromosome segregation protein Spo0J
LRLDPNNARRHDKKNLEAIKGSLSLFGQRKPIVISGDNTIVAGNGTVEAARELGWTEIYVARIPHDWTPEQIKAYALADNRTAELAEWDPKILADQLLELDAVGWDIKELGFESLDPTIGDDDNEPLKFESKYEVVVECVDELQQYETLEKLFAQGFKVRAIVL